MLIRDAYFYLCAPIGQIVEGYLVIAPYRCGSSLNRLASDRFPELERLIALLKDFYSSEYHCNDAIYYEQGRAGGNARIDPESKFPFHAHFCGVPVSCDLHGLLGRRYRCVEIKNLSELPIIAANEAYVYVQNGGRQCVYLGRSDEQRMELERFRLTPQLVQLLGLGEQETWRQHPGRENMESLIRRFKDYRSSF